MSNNKPFFDMNNRRYEAQSVPPVSTDSVDSLVKANTVVFKYTPHGTSFQKQAKAGEVTSRQEADEKMLIHTKRLIDPSYLDAIKKCDARFKVEVSRISLPASFLGDGIFLIPITMYSTLMQELKDFKNERKYLVQNLIDIYEEAIDDARDRLGTTFNENDYIPISLLRSKFYVSHSFWEVNTPESLQRLDEQAYREAQDEMRERMSSTVNEIQNGLRVGLSDLVDGLYDKVSLMSTENKKFYKGFVNNVKSFLELADAKNFLNDKDLQRLVEQARGLLDGVSPDDLREDDELRIQVEVGLSSIKDELDTMTEDTEGVRDFDL